MNYSDEVLKRVRELQRVGRCQPARESRAPWRKVPERVVQALTLAPDREQVARLAVEAACEALAKVE